MKIIFTGDYFYNFNFIAEDIKNIFNKIKHYDALFINYEGSFPSDKKKRKSVTLSMTSQSLELPQNTNLILCNNHATDFGEKGITTTINNIKERGINYFGINENIYDKSYILEKTIKKKKILIASLGWTNEECIEAKESSMGIKPFNSQSINELKYILENKNTDYNILYIHAGYEWEKYPLPEHVGLARSAIDAGFDFVYFCHSHIIQDYEFYKSKLIHYGIGNFYFSSRRNLFPSDSDKGCCLILSLENEAKFYFREIIYNRQNNCSTIEDERELVYNSLPSSSLEKYSKVYKDIRTRQKNPRPILYYNRNLSNFLKFRTWKMIVDILGFLKIRQFIKKLIGWN